VASNRYPLTLLPGRFAVCRLDPGSPLPPWPAGPLVSVTRTAEELSVVCAEESAPAGARAETGWKAFRLEGPVPFSTVGVISSMTAPLAAQGISVFVLSTFDTDYLLVKEGQLARAQKALAQAGYPVH
jgi:hypothetical protein